MHVEVLKTNPRITATVGEKHFFRAGNHLAIIMLHIGEGTAVLARASMGSVHTNVLGQETDPAIHARGGNAVKSRVMR